MDPFSPGQMPGWWAPKKMARLASASRASSSEVKKIRLTQPGIVGNFITSSRIQPRVAVPAPVGLHSMNSKSSDSEEDGSVEVGCSQKEELGVGDADNSSLVPSDREGNKGKSPLQESIDDDCKVIGEAAGKGKDIIVVDADLANAHPVSVKKRKGRCYELNRQFQDVWQVRFPWAESVLGANGCIAKVKCKICSQVEGLKLLRCKLDNLHKHAGRRRAKKDMKVGILDIKCGEYYILSTCPHIKNEKAYYMNKDRESVVVQLAWASTLEQCKKLVQFTLLFYVLSTGGSMSSYEGTEMLFKQLKVPNCPTRHWSDTAGWDMADSMAEMVKLKTKEVIAESRFLSVTADEVTACDNVSWLSIHVYTVKNYKRKPILLSLKRVVDGATAENLYDLIVSDLKFHGGLGEAELGEKLMCFGADGAKVFTGCKKGVTTLLKKNLAPYMLGVHCVAHRTNLAAEKLSDVPFVAKLEWMCTILNGHFSSSPKKFAEFQKLAEELDSGGNKLILNIKTRWISLLPVFNRVEEEYKALVVKMYIDSASSASAEKGYHALTDVSNLLALPCVLPLLRALNQLSKFAQGRDVFICEYVAAVKQTQMELYEMYVDPVTSFSEVHFQGFVDLVENKSFTITQEWVLHVETGVELLRYRIAGHTYETHVVDAVNKTRHPVTREEFAHCVSQVKCQCTAAAELIIAELEKRFPDHAEMDALGIVFPQFWLMENADELFDHHLHVLMKQYCRLKSTTYGDLNSGGEFTAQQVTEPLNGKLLCMQQHFFKMTMREHCETVCEMPRRVNPLTAMWSKINSSQYLSTRCSEFEKLAQIAVVVVIGSVEDERTFSTLKWVKSRIRNRLTAHLDTTVRMFGQSFYGYEDFPFAGAYEHWKEIVIRRGGTL